MKCTGSMPFFGWALSIFLFGAAVADDSAHERRLERGSRVAVSREKAPLGELLEAIEKTTGNAVRITDDFGRPDTKELARTVRVAKKGAPFWEALSTLTEQAGLELIKLERDGLKLAADVPHFRRNKTPAGGSVVAGAFLVEPVIDTFFDRLQLRLWPEPRYWAAEAKSYAVRWAPPGGEPRVWRGERVEKSVLDGAIELSVRPRFPEGIARLEKLQLRAEIAVPLGVQTVTSPPLAAMLPGARKAGKATVSVVEVAEEDDELRVRLEVFGRPVAIGRGCFIARGEKVEARSSGSSLDERTDVTLRLDRGGEKNLETDDLALVLALPVVETHRLGRIGSFRGDARKAGLSSITLKELETKGENLQLEIEARGEQPLWDELHLVDSKGTRVDPSFRAGGGGRSARDGGNWSYSFTFDASEVQGDPERAELVVDVPVSFDEAKIEAFSSSAARPWDEGVTRVRLLGVDSPDDDEDWRVRLEVEGATIDPESVRLVDRQGVDEEPRGWSASGTSGRQSVTLRFDVPRAERDPGSYRLRVQLPAGVLEHTVRATLEDVKVPAKKR